MLEPEYLEQAPIPILRLYNEFENFALFDIARRLKKMGEFTPTATYQMQTLLEFNMRETFEFEAEYKKRLQILLEKSTEEIDFLFLQAAEKSHEYDKRLFDLKNIPFVPVSENARLQQFIKATAQQTKDTFENITRTTAVKFLSPYKKFVPLPEAFRQHLDFAEFKVSTGVQDYNSAIKEAVRTLSDAGMRVIRYENEGKRKVVRRVETVARMTVLTGLANLAGAVSWENAKTLNAQHVIISAHVGSRESHQHFQGKVHALNMPIDEVMARAEALRNSS